MHSTLVVFAFIFQLAFSSPVQTPVTKTTPSPPAVNQLNKEIQELIHGSTVTLFSKTYCPFSKGVKRVLSTYTIKDLKVVELNLRNDTKLVQDELEKLSGIHTVPQLFVNGKFVGNHDTVVKLEKENKLRSILEDAKAIAPTRH